MTPSPDSRSRICASVGLAALAVISILAMAPAVRSAEIAGPAAPTSLRCEYLVNPMGIDMAKPRFFWVAAHSERGQVQSAYQVIVSTDPQADARETSGTAERSLPPNRRSSPSPGRPSRAASPISGKSAPGTGTAGRAPGAP